MNCCSVAAAALAVGAGLLVACGMPEPYAGLWPLPLQGHQLENLGGFPADFETGAIRKNEELLERAVKLFDGEVDGCEGVEVGEDGMLYMADRYGYLHVAERVGDGYSLQKNVKYIGPGRPLGLKLDHHDKTLLVADTLNGLISVPLIDRVPKGPATILANTDADGVPIQYVNDIGLSPDGSTIYFTSSTQKPVLRGPEGYWDTLQGAIFNFIHGDASGRVLKYTKASKKVETLRSGLWYANGVAASRDGLSLYYVETYGFRVLKMNLGTDTESVVASRLPGSPDGVSVAQDGSLWVSLVAPVPFGVLLAPYPALRLLLSRLPTKLLRMLAKPLGLAVRLSPDGEVLTTLMDPLGTRISSVSSTQQHGSRLFFGNLNGRYVSYYDL